MITSGSFWGVLFGSLLVYWLLPKWREPFIGAVSLAYLISLDVTSSVLLVGWSGAFYVATQKTRGVRGTRSWLAFVLIAGVLLTLGYFKYYPPLVFAVTSGAAGTSIAKNVVPLGISYFTFRLVAYMLDCVRGTMPAHGALRFFSYMTFFPIFTAGPIERFEPFLKNDPRAFDAKSFGLGIHRIIFGLVKKLVIVDVLLARTANSRYDFLLWTPPSLGQILRDVDAVPTFRVWQYTLNSFLSGYIDFSAYSDIAIGASLLFGYQIGENFDYPIFATNIGEFWKRWHMSLSGWCQRYVYMPTIAKTRNPYLSMYATMLTMALWHSGSLNLVCWGLYQATLLCLFQTWARFKRRRGWQLENVFTKAFGWALTMAATVVGTSFIATNSAGIRVGFQIFLKLFGVSLQGLQG